MQTCHADCAMYSYFLMCLELVHQCSDNIETHIVVRRFFSCMLVELHLAVLWQALSDFHEASKHVEMNKKLNNEWMNEWMKY